MCASPWARGHKDATKPGFAGGGTLCYNLRMYIAMNNFRVHPERSEDFERAWRERDSYLKGVPGFQQFHLLKGPVDDDGLQLYSSHTVWQDEASFRAWTESEAFRKAHAQGKLTGILAGPPKFLGWKVVDLS